MTIVAKAGIAVTGNDFAIGTTQPNIRLWNPIDPNVNQTWADVTTP